MSIDPVIELTIKYPSSLLSVERFEITEAQARRVREQLTHPFPMPNDRIGDSTVVASVWYTEDPPVATVLLLGPEPPFFEVAHYQLSSGVVDQLAVAENIVPAVREYEQAGGDY